MKSVTRIAALICLLVNGFATAEIYKSVDADGNVRYSDKPPLDQAQKDAEKFSLPNQRVKRNTTIKRAESNTRPAILETIRYQIADDVIDREIGKNYSVTGLYRQKFEEITSARSVCTGEGRPMDVSFAESTLKRGIKTYQRMFHSLLQDNGYKIARTNSAVFAAQAADVPEISIAALITEAYFERCARGSGLSFNKTDLSVEWQVFDNLAREVLFTTETSGSDDQFDAPPVQRGNIVSFDKAFKAAAEMLLADDNFLAAVASDRPATAKAPASSAVTEVSFEYGDNSTSFVDSSHLLEQGTVTIRTGSGHGSGFFISTAGHILTNAHVVAGSERVLVITSVGEEYADVLRFEPARDIALLQTDLGIAELPLKISTQQPRIGEQIYVVGTPLAEELSFSVTRGIVSGRRTLLGQSLIQTDAAVNPGNSGGPVVDQYGNVIALSVSGIFTKSGGSLNTNFLIPIDDALDVIGISLD